MPLLAKRELGALVESRPGPCVSIFMPTHRAAPEKRQNPADLKNLVRQGEAQLVASGLRAAQVEALLAPVRVLLENSRAWEHPGEGLALFLAPEFYREYHLPLPMEQLVTVAHRFHLKPLLPAFTNREHFYTLALSQAQVRLFVCTSTTVAEVDLGKTPRSLAEALNYDTPQKQVELRSARMARAGERGTAMFHGHAAVAVDQNRDLYLFFRQVDEGVHRALKEQRAPLVLAGVEYLLPLYRAANTYPNLVERGVEGNPELLTGRELQQRAWEVVKPLLEAQRQAAVARYYHLASTSLQATDDLERVVRAAYQGRVEVLWVARQAHRWGCYDPEREAVELRATPNSGAEDLLDFAAVHTLLNDGTVHVVEPAQVPEEAETAAIFRY